MDLETLELLRALAELGSVSKAADRLSISQSAASQRLRALEIGLGARLVERGRGRPGAQFTEAGQKALAAALEILARWDGLRTELAEQSGEPGGQLNVATVYSIGLHALTPALVRFLAQCPQVNLHLEYLRTDRIYEALLAGAIDCGIVACPRPRSGIEIVPLTTEPMVAIFAPGHPLAAETLSVSPHLLQGVPFVAFDPDIPTRSLIDDWLAAAGVRVRIIHAFDNIETIKRVVEIGQSAAIVPEPTVRREVRDGTLLALPLAGTPLVRPTGALLRKGRVPGRALARFLSTLTGERP